MHVDRQKQCTKVKAPRNTFILDRDTYQARPAEDVRYWLEENHIWEVELTSKFVRSINGDITLEGTFYFHYQEDAILFTLRWS